MGWERERGTRERKERRRRKKKEKKAIDEDLACEIGEKWKIGVWFWFGKLLRLKGSWLGSTRNEQGIELEKRKVLDF